MRHTGTVGQRRVGHHIAGWFARTWTRQPLPLDIAFYTICLGYAATMAATNEFYGYRVWGNFAIAGYGVALAHSSWLLLTARTNHAPASKLRSRWIGIGAIGVLAMLVPLGVLVVTRLSGLDWLDTPYSWSAQPEVWVIERSASLLLDNGTPYTDISALTRPPIVHDYTPYGPVMALFGLPNALLGGSALGAALTDARLVFALVAAGCVVASLRLLGRPRVPIRAAQLAVACPLTALTWAVAGPDLAILGLIVLAATLMTRQRIIASAVIIGLVVSAKLIALPAAAVLAVLAAARFGKRAVGAFLTTGIATCAAVTVPVLLVDPAAFLEHVIRFPAGLAAVSSPAASPLPGHLIASTGSAGQLIAFGLLCAAGLAICWWLIANPPMTTSDALLRAATGLGAFTLLTPATRFGYLVYPSVLLGAMLFFRYAERARATSS